MTYVLSIRGNKYVTTQDRDTALEKIEWSRVDDLRCTYVKEIAEKDFSEELVKLQREMNQLKAKAPAGTFHYGLSVAIDKNAIGLPEEHYLF